MIYDIFSNFYIRLAQYEHYLIMKENYKDTSWT